MKNYESYFAIDKGKNLLDYFPSLIFSDASEIESNAISSIKILQQLIDENIGNTVDMTRYANFQLFERSTKKNNVSDLKKNATELPDFYQNFGKFILPTKYHDYFDMLNQNESEVFMKLFLSAHNYWGKAEGISILVKTMLESVVGFDISVRIDDLNYEYRPIPENIISHLGSKNSDLGQNMVLGSSFKCRPRNYDIYVGPINFQTLDKFVDYGWCEDISASYKLIRLVELAEPYYLRARIHILLDKVGFTLGESKIGMDRLGENVVRHN